MSTDLEKIATYLNLAVRRTRQNGTLAWLTGAPAAVTPVVPAPQCEETQCLSFGSALWIANNDDADSTLQRTIVNQLGLSKEAKLLQHVETYFTRLLPYNHLGAVNVGAMNAKERLLLALNGGGAPAQAGLANGPGGGVAAAWGLAQAPPPPSSGVVFITGNYQSLGAANSYHAEQRLLAALGLYLRTRTITSQVTVSGIKTACNVCRGVLERVVARLALLGEPVRVRYQNATADLARVAAGLNPANPAGIHDLDVDHYFT